METPVPINEQTPQKENCVCSSEKDSPPVLQELQRSNKRPRSENTVGDEAPLSSSNESQLAQEKQPAPHVGPVSNSVSTNVSETPGSPVSNNVSTNVSETPVSSLNNSQFAVAKQVSNNVSTNVSETPVSSLNNSQFAVAKQVSNNVSTKGSETPGSPVSNNVSTNVSETPVSSLNNSQFAVAKQVSNNVSATVSETPGSPVSNNVSTKVSETPVSRLNNSQFAVAKQVSNNVSTDVSETPVSSLDDPQLAVAKQVDSSEGAVNTETVRVDEGSASNSIVIVHDETPVPTAIIRVPPEKRTLYKFGQRTSNFRGVTKHRWTGKFEAHLWDNSTITEGRKRKGKQVYLGGYESEQKAAQAYDLAALKYWGPGANTKLNFPVSTYEKELEEMRDMSREEYVNSLRRKSICFTRGHSIYRGVTRQNEGRRWQARIGRVAGGKDIYLGTYDTEEEAAEAYDIAAVKLRGMNAITNFDISNYYKEGTKELDVIPIRTVEEESFPHLRIRYFKLT